jgi:hypothetical protein
MARIATGALRRSAKVPTRAAVPAPVLSSTPAGQAGHQLARVLPAQPAAIPALSGEREAPASLMRMQPQGKSATGEAPLEAQADGMAARVMSGAPAGDRSFGDAAPSVRGQPGGVAPSQPAGAPQIAQEAVRSPGRPLDPETRRFFEHRFEKNFGNVRIHTDERAAAAAKTVGARAFAAGEHLVFGANEYHPHGSEGRRLIAHELAHVVQQNRDPQNGQQIHRKLIASGDTAGFASFANSVLGVQFEVVVSASGEVSLKPTNVAGPLTPEAQGLVTALKNSIDDSHMINMEFIHGTTSTRPEDAKIVGGSYDLSRVDLDDLSALGTQEGLGLGAGMTGGTALVHEVTEQYRKQVQGEAFGPAHAKATAAESAATGATRGNESFQQVNSTTLQVTIPYTYPDGHVVEETMDIVNGNFTNVRRKVIPAPSAAHTP